MFESAIQANKPIQITSKIEVKNEYSQLSQKLLNVSNKYITFTINNHSISFNERVLMAYVLKSVQEITPKDTQAIEHWKKQEKIIQLSSTFNRTFDATREDFANRHRHISLKLSKENKQKIYNQVHRKLQFGSYTFLPNAAQKSIEHILYNNNEIAMAIQRLVCHHNISDQKTINYITNYINSTINDELCQRLFPDLPLNEIKQKTKYLTSKLFNKLIDHEKYIYWQNYYKLSASQQTRV
ncbi:hypothetical protein [Providencia alcalifaciens]|uniref:hypothetical protein n=1 Tax=Providencia alcalifaciens TaxID=126385 RepID=UPI00029C4112|nr:hypothetical protein [Providencia alcalifaciens]EKT66457.1 hypothetical protein OO9_07862 [Providencia alcalifaciens Dmel2]